MLRFLKIERRKDKEEKNRGSYSNTERAALLSLATVKSKVKRKGAEVLVVKGKANPTRNVCTGREENTNS